MSRRREIALAEHGDEDEIDALPKAPAFHPSNGDPDARNDRHQAGQHRPDDTQAINQVRPNVRQGDTMFLPSGVRSSVPTQHQRRHRQHEGLDTQQQGVDETGRIDDMQRETL